MAAPTLKLLINNIDYTAYLEQNTWTITQNFGKYGNSIQFALYDEHAYEPGGVVGQTFNLQPMQSVYMYDMTLGRTLFGGIASQPAYTWLGPNLAAWAVNGRDWTYLADNAIVTAEFVSQSSDNILRTLVGLTGTGITTTNVHPGPYIDHVKINHMQLSAAFTLVAKLASQTIEYDWFIDENYDLHYFNWTQLAPIPTYFTDDVQDLNSNAAHYSQSNFQYLYDGQTLRNSITVRGANFISTTTDKFGGDGNTIQWAMTYPLNTNAPNLSLVVNGVAKTISIYTGAGDPQVDATTQYVVVQQPNLQWFLHVGTDTTPGASNNVVPINLTYKYQAPIVTQVNDYVSQTAYSGLPNKGAFQMYLADTSLITITSAKQRGQRELTQYSVPQERVTFTTTEDFLGHVRTGDVFRFKSIFVPDSRNNFTPGISALFLAINVTIAGVQGNYRNYSITAVRVSNT